MNMSELIVREILRTYSHSGSKDFLKGSIETIQSIKKSPFVDLDIVNDVIRMLTNFTTDEGLNDLWQTKQTEFFLEP